jgi:hypothetical protein
MTKHEIEWYIVEINMERKEKGKGGRRGGKR